MFGFQKVKERLKNNEGDLIIALSLLLIALIGFGLGRLSALQEKKTPIRIEAQNAAVKSFKVSEFNTAGLLVGSKNGKKFHYSWCAGAQKIKEENKIWFSSREEAEKLGYAPAANCEGL